MTCREDKRQKKLARKYTLMEYEVFVRLPPMGKDYNAFLQYKKGKPRAFQPGRKGKAAFTETKGTNIQKIEKMVGAQEHSTIPDSTGKIGGYSFGK